MRFDGLRGAGNANAGLSGIRLLSAATLSIENCVIFGFNSAGVDAANSGNSFLSVTNTNITNVTTGINASPGNGASLTGIADHVTIQDTSGSGIASTGGSVAFNVTNSNIVNASNAGVDAGPSANVVFDVDSSVVSNNNTGFATSGGRIRISRNQIYDNNTTYSVTGTGSMASSGDNYGVVAGTTPTFGTITRN